MSDIMFSGADVQVQGQVLRTRCWDIELDHASRRSAKNGNRPRRALVHDFQDGLTLNWDEDYPGGITLRGKVKVDAVEGSHLRSSHHDFHLDNAGRRSAGTGLRRALVHDFQDGLTLNWKEDYVGGVTIRGEVKLPQGAQTGRLTGKSLRLSHHTIHLDHAARRSNSAGSRRALVHDSEDGLTVNFKQDYPGGVTIRGEVKLPQGAQTGRLTGNHLQLGHHTLHLDHAARRSSSAGTRRALVHDTQDGLTVNFGQDYPGGVTIRGDVKVPGTLLVKNKDLLALISDLQQEVQQLKQRVEALEAAGS
jgi:hypothetical protein